MKYKMTDEERRSKTLGAYRHWKGPTVILPTVLIHWWADCLTRSELDPNETHAMFIASNALGDGRLRCHGCRP